MVDIQKPEPAELQTNGSKKRVGDYRLLSVRQLMVRKFMHNQLAVIAAIVLVMFYLTTIFAGFFAPYGPQNADSKLSYSPPYQIHFLDSENGRISWRPFVYRLDSVRNKKTFRLEFVQDTGVRDEISFFVRGDTYKLFWLFESDMHLFGVLSEGARLHLLGSDKRGRDLLSRILFGGQVSLSVGLVGVAIMVFLGSIIGTLSGYYGGWFDAVSQRFIETLRVFPDIPLWMALSAAIPPQWPPEWVYAGIVMVLSFIGWTGLARELRGLILSVRGRDFVLAAEASGASTARIMRKHLIPTVASHIIVTATLAVPITILGESALSFLGIGVRPPMISWGLLLSDAFNVQVIAQQPWMLAPAGFILFAVLAFNFVGDGLRDVVDPFS